MQKYFVETLVNKKGIEYCISRVNGYKAIKLPKIFYALDFVT